MTVVPRRYNRPGDVTLDHAFAEAWLVAAAGDTLAALTAIDRALDGLPMSAPSSLIEVPVMAALVRLHVLGAQLAARVGDSRSARRWADRAIALWSGADPALQPVVAEMRSIAAGTGTSR